MNGITDMTREVKLSDDEQLAYIEAAKAGDRNAIEALLAQYQGMFYSLIHSLVGANRAIPNEDLYQESVICFMKCIRWFDVKRGTKLGTLAHVSMRRAVWRMLQIAEGKRKREGRVIARLAELRRRTAERDPDPPQERLHGLYQAMSKHLTVNERRVIQGKLEGSTHEQIGKEMGITHQRVTQLAGVACNKLRETTELRDGCVVLKGRSV